MPTFPISEANVLELAQELQAGLSGASVYFPAPPIPPANLSTLIDNCLSAKNSMVEAQGTAKTATTAKDDAVQVLIDAMKSDLRYAEYEVDGDDDKLTLLGWGGKKPPEPIVEPGQPPNFISVDEGAGTIGLTWDVPVTGSGGTVTSYSIERRDQPLGGGEPGTWEQTGISFTTETTLTDQPRGIQLEYRVFGINKAGTSIASNIVAAVL